MWVIRFHKYFLLFSNKKKILLPHRKYSTVFFWVVVPLQLVDDVIRILHRLSVCLSVRRMTIERRDDAVPAALPHVMAVIDLILSNHSSNTHTHILNTCNCGVPIVFCVERLGQAPSLTSATPKIFPPLKFLHFFLFFCFFLFIIKSEKEKMTIRCVYNYYSIATLFYFFFFIISSSYLLWSRIC